MKSTKSWQLGVVFHPIEIYIRGIRLSSEVAAWIGQNLKRAVSGNTHDAYLWIDADLP